MLSVREYGTNGPLVVVLHGGPGAPGGMAPVARELAADFRVLEPIQRHSGGPPLSVQVHVDDLHEVVAQQKQPAVLVGASWGAMLALVHAAQHPTDVRALVLVGCGTFDRVARNKLVENLDARMTHEMRSGVQRFNEDIADPDERMRLSAELFAPLYSYDPIERPEPPLWIDSRGHEETWRDMVRLQDEGTYPAGFRGIDVPVLMLHGADDPHPGQMVRASLLPFLPQLEYHEWEDCGHEPWRERAVRSHFFSLLKNWIHERGVSSAAANAT